MDQKRYAFYLLIAAAVFVNFAGINNRFFTDDPALYASIAKNILRQKNISELFTYNQDWLDKPHFSFWVIAISFKLFGISEWAYRLPALAFFLMSLLYTYLFSKKYYGKETGLIAVLILATALHTMLSNTDVRAEPYLMGLLMGSVYHIANLKDLFKAKDLLLAAIFTAAAIMTKGIFIVIPIGGGLLAQLYFTKDLKALIDFKWLWMVSLTLLLIMPELYSLHRQFDLHPEKMVFGKQHVSGTKWFLWDSQFGRFANSGPISRKGQGNIFFYLHTLLWALAPWSLLFFAGIYKKIKATYQRQRLPEYYALGGGVLLLLLFSLSRFQLPFYTNAVFPLFAIITAPVINTRLSPFASKLKSASLWVFIVALPVAVLLLNCYSKPGNTIYFWIGCMLLALAVLSILLNKSGATYKVFFMACCSALFAGFYLNTVFYRLVTGYNGQIAAAEYVNSKHYKNYPVYTLNERDNAFQFYCDKPVTALKPEDFEKINNAPPLLFYARQSTLDYLDGRHTEYKLLRSFINYPQENILPNFMDAKTRGQVLNRVYIISNSLSAMAIPLPAH